MKTPRGRTSARADEIEARASSDFPLSSEFATSKQQDFFVEREKKLKRKKPKGSKSELLSKLRNEAIALNRSVLPEQYVRKNVTADKIPEEYIPLPLRALAKAQNWPAERIVWETKKAFAYYFTGNLGQTITLMLEDGWGEQTPTKETALTWLWEPEVRRIIDERLDKVKGYKRGIATREELQIWWTAVMRSEKVQMSYRLKASELLAKSHAMFADIQITNHMTLKDVLVHIDTKAREQELTAKRFKAPLKAGVKDVEFEEEERSDGSTET